MAKIMLDAGHGYPDNRGGVGINEGENNYYLTAKIKEALEKSGHTVGLTRKGLNDDPSLSTRSSLGNGYDLYLSIHSNAVNGSVSGVEIYDSTERPSFDLASRLCSAIAKALLIDNRGVRYRSLNGDWDVTYKPRSWTKNYYAVLRGNGAKKAMLVENFYHDNKNDVAKYKANTDKLVKAYVDVINEFFGVSNTKHPILNKASVTVPQMQDWARKRNADPEFIEQAETYYNISVIYGIDPAITYAQSAKETNYFKFGGVLDKSFRNPCGLKTTKGGDNYDKNAHKRFTSWEEGIEAQVQHLALYAGHPNSPWSGTALKDPRHFDFIKGTAKFVEDLGGKWAPASNYGTSIMDMIISMRGANNMVQDTKKGDMKSIIAYGEEAKEFALELSKRLNIATLNKLINFDYYGIERVICVGEESTIKSFTSYMTHFVNAKDNWGHERNESFLKSATENIDRFRKENK